jgi:hypothetical protein
MNNASKGRCVTVTPRGKSEDETLKAKPGIRKGQYWAGGETEKPLSGRKFHCPTITTLIYPWQVWKRICRVRLRTVNRDPSLFGVLG